MQYLSRKNSETFFEKFNKEKNSYLIKQLKLLNENKSFSEFNNFQLEVLYGYIKRACQIKNTGKWSIKLTIILLRQNNINPIIFIKLLHKIKTEYFQDSKKGYKSFWDYVNRLEKSKQFAKLTSVQTKINLAEDVNVLNFLSDMKKLNKHLDINHTQTIDLIHTLFHTGLSKSTLTRYYRDKTI